MANCSEGYYPPNQYSHINGHTDKTNNLVNGGDAMNNLTQNFDNVDLNGSYTFTENNPYNMNVNNGNQNDSQIKNSHYQSHLHQYPNYVNGYDKLNSNDSMNPMNTNLYAQNAVNSNKLSNFNTNPNVSTYYQNGDNMINPNPPPNNYNNFYNDPNQKSQNYYPNNYSNMGAIPNINPQMYNGFSNADNNTVNANNVPYHPMPQNAAGFNQQQPQMIGSYPTGQPPPMRPSYGQTGPTASMMGTQQFPPPQAAAPAAKKLDPDTLPNPIQIIEDDKSKHTGVYRCEDNRDAIPPAVTTDFIADNNVNCSPRFIRSTLYCAPCTQDMVKMTSIPFAISISPFAELNSGESPLPLIDFGEMGPVRCNRCKAYVSSFMQFNDGGRKFFCPFCKTNTEVPAEYFNHLDYNGKRIDLAMRPELFCGSYEMVATKEYCKNNEFPQPPALIFMFDVSYNAMHSGLIPLICQNIKQLLIALKQNNEASGINLRIGIMTYDAMIHFYLARNTEHPKIVFEPDLNEVFVPSHHDFLLPLEEMIESIDSISEQILANFTETKLTEIMLGPAIQAGMESFKQANCSGKLMVFHTSLPLLEAPGKLENKDDPKLLGTEKEKNILLPSNPFYTKLGESCVQAGCGIDLFVFPNQYINLATMGEICRVTGGHIYKYDCFRADVDGERLITHLHQIVKKPIAFDCIMKVRTSTGLRPVEYYGNFFMENSTDVECAILDSENNITVELKHDDKLSEQELAYIQVAILYTSLSGQRRLRIHNLSMRASNLYSDLYKLCDQDALMNFLAKQAVRGIFLSSPKQVRESVTKLVAQTLASYRRQCATNSNTGQLILPECLKLLPLYASCLLKTDGILGGVSIKTDERNWILYLMRNMNVFDSNYYIYPRLFPLHTIDLSDESITLPPMLRCSAAKIEQHGVYLIANGLYIFMWIGNLANQEFVQEVFGLNLVSQIDVNRGLPRLQNAMSQRVNTIVSTLQSQSDIFPKLILVRESDAQATWVKRLLLEDQSTISGEVPSYVDYLCFIYKEIRGMIEN